MRRFTAHSRFRSSLSWLVFVGACAFNTAAAVFFLLIYAGVQ